MVLKSALGWEYLLLNWASKTVDALFIHNKKTAVGSIVYCNLGLAFEHTGICVDGEHMVHLSGQGVVELVDAKKFCGRLMGKNPSFTIFCPVRNGRAMGDEEVARRALSLVGQHKKYNLILSNCHCFSAYCLTGHEVYCPSFTELELFFAEGISRLYLESDQLTTLKIKSIIEEELGNRFFFFITWRIKYNFSIQIQP